MLPGVPVGDIMNGWDSIVERRDKPLSLQEFCNKDATGFDMSSPREKTAIKSHI